MRNRVILPFVLACAVAGGGVAKVSAQSCAPDQPCGSDSPCASNVPRSMFFVGAGAGLGIVASGEQSVTNTGITNIFKGDVLTSTGTATGPPVTPTLGAKCDCVPTAQVGYFEHFGDGDWLWGVKFSYSYLDKTLTRENLIIPQFGITSNPAVPTFPGSSVTRSYDVFLDHQLSLLPFVGRSFDNGFVYAGAGPTLSHVGASLNDVVGFANLVGGTPPLSGLVDISGRPQSDAQTQWAFGIGATVGVTYFITPNCFLDFSYTYSHPFSRTFHVEGPFRNDAFSPFVLTGTLIGDYTAKVDTHLLMVTLNVGF